MSFLDDSLFSLRMTIGSVVLKALTSPGAIEAQAISLIYSDFFPDGVWVADIYDWVLVS